MTEQFKRNVAYKLRIGDLIVGKPITENDRFSFLELGDKKIIRTNVVGNIVDKFESSGERKYIFLTLDDGSGQVSVKVFGDDVEKFKEFSHGMTVVIIGLLRFWNNQLYITPEIIKEQDPKYLIVRKLETEREKNSKSDGLGKEQIIAVKDTILRTIKNSENDGGIDIDKIIMTLREISPVIIQQEVQKFLEEGIIFEPRPGKVRYLG